MSRSSPACGRASTTSRPQASGRRQGIGPENWEPLPEEGLGRTPTFTSGMGVEIYTKWNFVGIDTEGIVHIIDWKTESETDVARRKALSQLATYASWAARTIALSVSIRRSLPIFHLSGGRSRSAPRSVRRSPSASTPTSTARWTLLEQRTDDSGRVCKWWVRREDFVLIPRTHMCLECEWLPLCPEGQAYCNHTSTSFARSEPTHRDVCGETTTMRIVDSW